MGHVNVTFSFPEDLYKKMKMHKEVNWSAVVRKAVSEYLKKIELGENTLSMKELHEQLKKLGFKIEEISLEEAIEYYEKMRDKEWKRTSMTQTS